ncbi:MAG: putative lipid II flippase FtsW [Gammaproteobacteria bacterium]|nr:putative lipid II flippase FtsW [Gammaproteobacteria bacterium]
MSRVLTADDTRAAGRARAPWDYTLIGAVLALASFGLVMVHSASVDYATRTQGSSLYFLLHHGFYLFIGAIFAAFAVRTRVSWWAAAGPYLLLVGLVLLVVVLLPGIGMNVNGSSRWLRLGLITVQPSEFMKLFIVAYVAGYLVRKQEELKKFTRGILMIGIVVAMVGILLLLEPDLGSVVVISITVLTMLFLGGVRFWHFMLVVGAGAVGVVALTLIAPYRMNRVTSFLDPWADPFGTGFQLVQALIAFGRGEWFGVGLGASVQKLSYLPAAHTDFLMAVIAEELGLMGVLTVIGLIGVITLRAFAIARQAEAAGQLYGARLAQGLGMLLSTQAMINLGVNMGLLPTKGLTLPFLSYGGSSIVVCSIAAGLLLMIERESRGLVWGRH